MRPLKLLPHLFGIVLLSLLLVSCQITSTSTPTLILPTPTTEPTSTSSATEVLSPAKPLYAPEGKYQVGLQDLAIQNGNETVNISVFYPELNAAPDTTHGPYPLVIFSPGLGAVGKDYENLLRPIASYGFVIIALTPRGETNSEFWVGAATRPLDIKFIANYADKLTATGGQFAGMIDTERIAVAGHSSGGWAALVGGGARMDMGWCAAHPDLVAKLALSNCTQFLPHQSEIATMLGIKSAPTGLWPPMNDPRVVAVIAASPDGDIWGAGYGGVSAMKVPTLIMAGSADTINIPELCAYPIYEHLGSAKKTLVVFENGDHGLGWDTYSDEIKHVMIAFLLAELKSNSEAVNALFPANVTFPGIKYETTVSNTR